jgi:hypothetical protein
MRVLLAGAVLVLSAVLHVASASPAGACSCVGFTDDEAFARADAVFVGDVSDYSAPDSPTGSTDPALWTFSVTDVYKGDIAARQVVASAVSGASCGLEIPHEGRVLVFARREPQVLEPRVDGVSLYAGLCDGTRQLIDRPVPAAFGTARAPSAPAVSGTDAGPDRTSRGSPPWALGVLAVALVLLVAGVTVRARASRTMR